MSQKPKRKSESIETDMEGSIPFKKIRIISKELRAQVIRRGDLLSANAPGPQDDILEDAMRFCDLARSDLDNGNPDPEIRTEVLDRYDRYLNVRNQQSVVPTESDITVDTAYLPATPPLCARLSGHACSRGQLRAGWPRGGLGLVACRCLGKLLFRQQIEASSEPRL
jgi:hypothetical protein